MKIRASLKYFVNDCSISSFRFVWKQRLNTGETAFVNLCMNSVYLKKISFGKPEKFHQQTSFVTVKVVIDFGLFQRFQR